MKATITSIVLAVTMSLSCYTMADQNLAVGDPLQRNLIFVEGSAEVTETITAFEMRLGFDLKRETFTEASQASDRLTAAITKAIRDLGLQEVEAVKGWDFLNAESISFGAKGKNIATTLTVRVRDLPAGKLHALMAQAIDRTLAVDKTILLEDIRVYPDKAVTREMKRKAAEAAVRDLHANAQRLAAALGKEIATPKRIYTMGDEALASQIDPSQGRNDGRATIRKSILFSKSYGVKADIVEQVKLTATVGGVFEIK